MSEDGPLYRKGAPNPEVSGFIPVRSAAGGPQSEEELEEAAGALAREVSYVDPDGYECELIAGAIAPRSVNPKSAEVSWVESRAKALGEMVDISIKIHHRSVDGAEREVDIKSYNPFFGCDVCLFRWEKRETLFVYREKHRTYVAKFGETWPPLFVEIEDEWWLIDGVLYFRGWDEGVIKRLKYPTLEPMDDLSIKEAKELGVIRGGSL